LEIENGGLGENLPTMPLATKVRWKQTRMASALIFLFFVTLINGQAGPKCNKSPIGQSALRTYGDGGFHVEVVGSPRLYRPGQEYTVSLRGIRVEEEDDGQPKNIKFISFMIVAESNLPSTEVTGLGTFRLKPKDAMATFSLRCSHAVGSSSALSKEMVDIFWTAPEAGSGCIFLKAMVVERNDLWYMDDGGLTYQICEDDSPMAAPPLVEPCKACNEAKYEVIFEGLWSRHTHPKDFPKDEWKTQFSSMIGASHSINYDLWKYGELASLSLTEMAEHGYTKKLERNMKISSKHIRSVIKARGLEQRSNLVGRTFAVFRMDATKHLLSLVSKIEPSPDWIVGVSRENLCLANGSWVDSRVIDLFPWDAGTNSGLSYEDHGHQTQPGEAIHRITSCNPSEDSSPFFDPTCAPMKPVARLQIIKQREYRKQCDGLLGSSLHQNPYGSPNAPSLNEDNGGVFSGPGIGPTDVEQPTDNAYDYDYNTYRDARDQCETTEWSRWTACSQTCDLGSRSRSRAYNNPVGASINNCQTKLFEKEKCKSQPKCQTKNYGKGYDPFFSQNELSGYTSQWSNRGLSSHSLKTDEEVNGSTSIIGNDNNNGKKSYLYRGPQAEKQVGKSNSFNSRSPIDPYNDLYSGYAKQKGYPPRTNDPSSARYNPYKEMGYYGYTYGGPPTGRYNSIAGTVNDEQSDSSPTCDVTTWGDWSQCSTNCGTGTKTRTRTFVEMDSSSCSDELYDQATCEETSGCSSHVVEVTKQRTRPTTPRPASYGGKQMLPSPRKLVGRKKFGRGDPQCDTATWTQWSPCSVTCDKGYKIRTRVYKMPFVPNRICDNLRLTQKQDCRMPSCWGGDYYDANDSPPMDDSEEIDFNNIQEDNDKSSMMANSNAKQMFCNSDPNPGIGRGSMEQWFYNHHEGLCQVFKYTGVGGNKNNFATKQECMESCHPEVSPSPLFRGLSSQSLVREDYLMAEQAANDCQVSGWTEWSSCSASCGRGWMTKERHITKESRHGGKPCPRKLTKKKKCKALMPCAASPSQWYQGNWRMMQE